MHERQLCLLTVKNRWICHWVYNCSIMSMFICINELIIINFYKGGRKLPYFLFLSNCSLDT